MTVVADALEPPRMSQQVLSGQLPWPEIPDSETALKNQIAFVQLQQRERSGGRMQNVETWRSL